MNWIDSSIKLPSVKGYYVCWCPEVPPQSHPMQILKFDKDYYGNFSWFTSWGVSHWAEIVPPNALTRSQHDRKALEAEQLHIKELRELLVDAAERIQEWGNYADDYFQEKWNLAGDVNKYKQASLAKQPDTRALDKALLEARIDQMDWVLAWNPLDGDKDEYSRGLRRALRTKLAELNKE